MRFVGIWFNMDREIKRDYCNAKDSTEASRLIHAMYPDGKYPGAALTVIPASGASNPSNTSCTLA